MPRPPHTRLTLLLLALVMLATVQPAAAISYKLERTFVGPEFSYGRALAANARHVVIGSDFEGSAAGAVYVYDRATGALRARLVSPAPRYFFGHDVALDGDLVVVGEQRGGVPVAYDDAGAVHLFDADTGALVRTLVNPDPQHYINLGTAVAAADGIVVASAPFVPFSFNHGGVAYVFEAATGKVLHTLVDPTPDSGSFGIDVAIAGGEILIGEARDDEPGAVWRFDRATGALLGALHHPDPAVRGFGAPLAVDDARIVVGGTNAVFSFDRATGALERTFTTPFPDGRTFGRGLDLGAAGLAITQPTATRYPVRSIVGAVLIYDPATGALRTTIAESTGAVPAPEVRQFGRGLLLDHDDVFVSAGTENAPEVQQYVLACGDGVVDPCERCDDGNRAAGDGCDDDCQLESCGDGVVQAGEDCDDGNAVDGDGCDTTCAVSGCGNCVVAADEQCDDGNTLTGDACDANCTWASCRNGEVGPFEGCDDGNATAGDGCSAVCKAEICGDAALDAGESCDDGNLDGGDGCDASCRLETAKLDWWRRIYGVFAGDYNPYYGRQQLFVTDHALFILATGGDGYAVVYDRETGERLHIFPDGDAAPLAVDGDAVLVADNSTEDTVVHLYDAATFALRQTFGDPIPDTWYGFARFVAAIDGTVLIHDTTDGVHLFDAATGAFRRTLTEPVAPNAPTPPNPGDFGFLMAAFRGGALLSGTHAAYLFDLSDGTLLRTFTGPNGAAVLGTRTIALGGDVVLQDASGAVHLLDGATGTIRHTFAALGGPGTSVRVVDDAIVLADAAHGVVQVFDAASYELLRTLHDPVPTQFSCFGSGIARLDLGLAVSDPCDGDDTTGVVYVFDDARAQLIATIPDPNGDYLDFFGTRAAFGNTLLTKYQASDSGIVNAWRPTSDGVLEPGEECDDGNLVNGDGCDMNGTIPRCGNGFVTAGETCDDGNRISGDGCERDCRPTFSCSGPAALGSVQLVLRNLGGKPGDETIALTGRLIGIDPTRSALADGAQVLVEDADGVPLFDLTSRTTAIAPGARRTGCGKADGWRADAQRETYVNGSDALPPACVPGSAAGLTRLVLAQKSDATRSVLLRARHATVPAFRSPLRVLVALGADSADSLADRCGSHAFTALECRANRRGTTLICH